MTQRLFHPLLAVLLSASIVWTGGEGAQAIILAEPVAVHAVSRPAFFTEQAIVERLVSDHRVLSKIAPFQLLKRFRLVDRRPETNADSASVRAPRAIKKSIRIPLSLKTTLLYLLLGIAVGSAHPLLEVWNQPAPLNVGLLIAAAVITTLIVGALFGGEFSVRASRDNWIGHPLLSEGWLRKVEELRDEILALLAEPGRDESRMQELLDLLRRRRAASEKGARQKYPGGSIRVHTLQTKLEANPELGRRLLPILNELFTGFDVDGQLHQSKITEASA